MQNIYQCAAFNIAATAAKDSSEGLFYTRDPREIQPFNIDAAWILSGDMADNLDTFFQSFRLSYNSDIDTVVDRSPLNRRAWVMQERYLSRRIIHYSSEQIFWECLESYVSETHPGGVVFCLKPCPAPRGLKLKLISHFGPNANDDQIVLLRNTLDREYVYTAWIDFICWYTSCDLTYWEDRLVAIQGITRHLENVLQDELVAGLWRSRLLHDLCWSSVPVSHACRKVSSWVAPSWSWVSSFRPVPMWWHDLDDAATVIHVAVRAKKSGALIEGSLTLRCRLIAATLSPLKKSVVFELDTTDYTWLYGSGPRSAFRLDDQDIHLGEHPQVFLTVLRHGPTPEESISGLILIRSAQEPCAFERVGAFFNYRPVCPYDPFFAEIATRHKVAQEQTIKLI